MSGFFFVGYDFGEMSGRADDDDVLFCFFVGQLFG